MVYGWYKISKEVNSMRKHVLRVDFRVYPGDETDTNSIPELANKIKTFLTSAIIKGLDVIGVVSDKSALVANLSIEVAKKSGLDLYVIGGQEYKTSDGFHIIVYNAKDNVPPNLTYDQTVEFTRERGGLVMLFKLSKRQLQQVNNITNTHIKPDLIEIYDAVTGTYQDIHTEYPCVMSSASRFSKELENIKLFTLFPRKKAEELKIIPDQFGIDFTPNYLKSQGPRQPQQPQQGVK